MAPNELRADRPLVGDRATASPPPETAPPGRPPQPPRRPRKGGGGGRRGAGRWVVRLASLGMILVLAAGLFLPHPQGLVPGLVMTAVGVLALVAALAIAETWQAKARLLRAPALLAAGLAVAVLGLAAHAAGVGV